LHFLFFFLTHFFFIYRTKNRDQIMILAQLKTEIKQQPVAR
jgi:cbb3-type cytochrome oxidase subunit 3